MKRAPFVLALWPRERAVVRAAIAEALEREGDDGRLRDLDGLLADLDGAELVRVYLRPRERDALIGAVSHKLARDLQTELGVLQMAENALTTGQLAALRERL